MEEEEPGNGDTGRCSWHRCLVAKPLRFCPRKIQRQQPLQDLLVGQVVGPAEDARIDLVHSGQSLVCRFSSNM